MNEANSGSHDVDHVGKIPCLHLRSRLKSRYKQQYGRLTDFSDSLVSGKSPGNDSSLPCSYEKVCGCCTSYIIWHGLERFVSLDVKEDESYRLAVTVTPDSEDYAMLNLFPGLDENRVKCSR
jgi:hypothetical protein